MPMFEKLDHVMMKNGSSYLGKIKTRSFKFKVDEIAEPLTIKTKKLVRIQFRNDYGHPFDQATMLSGQEIGGQVITKAIKLESEELGAIPLHTKDILAIQFMGNIPHSV